MRGSRLQDVELELLERNRYAQRLGVVVEECAQGSALVLLPVRSDILNRGGLVHGGAIASGLLSAATLAAASSERARDARRALPLSFSVCFLEAVREREIAFSARVMRRGRSVVQTSIEAACGVARIAAALAVHGIEHDETDAVGGFTATPARALSDPDRPPVRMSGSPYGAAAGIEVLSEIGSEAWLRMPSEPNAGPDGCADPGAVVGLIDNCGAFATYSHPGVSIEQSGATVSMNVSFCPPVAGPLRAVGRVVGRSGDAFSSEVEVAGVENGLLAATASLLYRMRSSASAGAGSDDEQA